MVLFVFALQIKTQATTGTSETRKDEDSFEPWHYRQLVWGVLGVFLYIGIEATIVGMFVNFISEPQVANVPVSKGGFYLTSYFVGFTLARFAGAAIQRRIKPNKLLMVHGLINIALILGVMLLHGMPVVLCLVLTGVFNSIMFPAIFSLGIQGLGKLEARASGILFMAFSGAAVVPVVQGAVADRWGTQISFVVMMCCYAYILFFAGKGYKPGLFKVKSRSLAVSQRLQ
jgi:FHS family L-fucose permease-like MFS transporter